MHEVLNNIIKLNLVKKVIICILVFALFSLFVHAENLRTLVLLEGNYSADNVETFGIYADYNDAQIKAKGISIDLKSDNLEIISFTLSEFLNIGRCKGGMTFENNKICVDFVNPKGFSEGEELGRFSVRWDKYNGDADIEIKTKYIHGENDFLNSEIIDVYSYKIINGTDRIVSVSSINNSSNILNCFLIGATIFICIVVFGLVHKRNKVRNVRFGLALLILCLIAFIVAIYFSNQINILPLTGDNIESTIELNGRRYIDRIFSEYTVQKNISYGTSILDIYQPKGDTLQKRPVLIMVHGGGFVMGSKAEWEGQAIQFAKRGYVTITADYRLADPRNVHGPFSDDFPYEPIKNAKDDILAVVRWVRSKASNYRLDGDRIAVMGNSAGAVTSLYTAYDTEDVGHSGNPGYSSKISAAVSVAGGMRAGEIHTINSGDPPSLIFHGLEDKIVPVQTVKQVESKLISLHIPYEAYYYPGMGHSIPPDFSPKTVNFLVKYVINTIMPTVTVTPTATATPAPTPTLLLTPTEEATPTPTITITITPTMTPIIPEGLICGYLDTNLDTVLDIIDFVNFSKYYGKNCRDIVPKVGCGGKDTNYDGRIDILDLIYLSENYHNVKSDCTRY